MGNLMLDSRIEEEDPQLTSRPVTARDREKKGKRQRDPLAVALKARIDSGGLNTRLRHPDAKKKNIYVPAALNLKV